MKKPILLLIILFSITLYAQQQKKKEQVFILELKLLNKNIHPYEYFNPAAKPFWAQVKLSNVNAHTFLCGNYLPFGWKYDTKQMFYLEATDLLGKEEDIRFNGTYAPAGSLKEIELYEGRTITDTLNIPVIYSFKNPGVYKVRAVFNTYLAYTHNAAYIDYGQVYSNWDTVYVKE